MPLLRRQPFHRQKPPLDLRPDEEVFLCKLTNEIFRDYEEFFERVILCNSLVWSCSVTGRAGLTYQEAVECEEKALKHLATFPDYLQRPILFLATLTHRSRLVDMNDDVFVFAKDRYFVGEMVDVAGGDSRKMCKILKVLPPAGSEKVTANAGDIDNSEDEETLKRKQNALKPDLYQYMVLEKNKSVAIRVRAKQISRKRGLYTRDKSKLFLKQHCEPQLGLWKVKDDIVKKLKLDAAKFEDFFSGPRPAFIVSKIKRKSGSKKPDGTGAAVLHESPKKRKDPDERRRQSLENASLLMDTDEVNKTQLTPEEKAAIREQLKQERLALKQQRKEEVRKKMEEERMKKKEERAKEREKKMEEQRVQMEYLREWSRLRDDLQCDDLRVMPELTPVRTTLPAEYFGDAMMILEFLKSFSSLFEIEEYFHDGLTFAELEKALTSPDVNSPLVDILQLLLVAIFGLQEEEEEDDHEPKFTKSGQISTKGSISLKGVPLKSLPFDSFTLTEILRLHIMSSGAKACRINSCRFRYQQRGGYTPMDDPGFDFCNQEVTYEEIMLALTENNIFDLSPGDRVKILNMLVHQFLTYAATRDLVEDNFDKLKQMRNDLKQLQWGEQRREREVAGERYRRRLEEKAREREKMEQLRLQRLQEKEEQMKADETKTSGTVESESVPTSNPEEPTEEKNSAKKQRKTRGNASREVSPVPKVKLWEDMTPEERAEVRDKEEKEEAQKKEDFLEEEKELIENIIQLQHGNATYPLGRDRLYRRYWMFQSLPGLFIEDNEQHVCEDLLQPGKQDMRSNSFNTAFVSQKVTQPKTKPEEPNTGSDKENDSFNAPGENQVVPNGENIVENGSATNTENKEDIIVISDDENGERQETKPITPKMEVDDFEQEEEMEMESMAVHQILNRTKQPWSYVANVEQFDELINSLNTRGLRESQLKTALLDQRQRISNWIFECPVDTVCSKELETTEKTNSKTDSSTSVKSVTRNKMKKGMVIGKSAQQELEVNLRDMVLDLEERIYAGSLGSIKVQDRLKWRIAIHEGGYSPETDDPLFNNEETETKMNGIEKTEDDASETSETMGVTVAKELAKALYQVQKCLEPKYLIPPLGEDDKTKHAKQKAKEKKKEKDDSEDSEDEEKPVVKPILERWGETLRACTSLPQVFLHLATLEKSIAWSKSALHARCRVCRRKGDGEHMLLCDGCDRGHHTFCLKPPVTKIPEGDWFCPTCRPKEKRSPRKDRKKTYESSEEEEEESGEEEEAEEEEEESGEEEEEDSDQDSDSEDLEEDSVEEEEVANCAVCQKTGTLICCDACPLSYHLKCAVPQIKKVPKGKWLCQNCLGIGKTSKIKLPKVKAKLKKSSTPKSTPPSSRNSSRRESPSPVPPKNAKKRGTDLDLEDEAPKLKKGGRSMSKLVEADNEGSKSSSRCKSRLQPMKTCEDIVGELMKHEDAWPFLKPVSKKNVPDYYEIIKHPMDFSLVRTKMNKYEYIEPEDLIRDARQIFANCEEYNKKGTPEYKAGTALCKLLEKRVREAGLDLDHRALPKKPKRS
ncbi:hypothetical protein ScPMuIL_013816 [Solemya velum]